MKLILVIAIGSAYTILGTFLLTWIISRGWHCVSTLKRLQALDILRSFRWFCSKENRLIIELIIADLKKERRDMRREGKGNLFVGMVLLWHAVFGTMLPIVWDGACRLLSAILPMGKLIGGIKGIWLK